MENKFSMTVSIVFDCIMLQERYRYVDECNVIHCTCFISIIVSVRYYRSSKKKKKRSINTVLYGCRNNKLLIMIEKPTYGTTLIIENRKSYTIVLLVFREIQIFKFF